MRGEPGGRPDHRFPPQDENVPAAHVGVAFVAVVVVAGVAVVAVDAAALGRGGPKEERRKSNPECGALSQGGSGVRSARSIHLLPGLVNRFWMNRVLVLPPSWQLM